MPDVVKIARARRVDASDQLAVPWPESVPLSSAAGRRTGAATVRQLRATRRRLAGELVLARRRLA